MGKKNKKPFWNGERILKDIPAYEKALEEKKKNDKYNDEDAGRWEQDYGSTEDEDQFDLETSKPIDLEKEIAAGGKPAPRSPKMLDKEEDGEEEVGADLGAILSAKADKVEQVNPTLADILRKAEDKYDKEKKRIGWIQAAESIGLALSKMFAAKHGLANNIDMTSLASTKGSDFSSQLDRALGKYKHDTSLLARDVEGRKARDERAGASAASAAARGELQIKKDAKDLAKEAKSDARYKDRQLAIDKRHGESLAARQARVNKAQQTGNILPLPNGGNVDVAFVNGRNIRVDTQKELTQEENQSIIKPGNRRNNITGDWERYDVRSGKDLTSEQKKSMMVTVGGTEVPALLPNQIKGLDKIEQEIDKVVEKPQGALRQIDTVRETIKRGGPIAAEAIKSLMPRTVGEVGNLAQAEQERFGGSQAARDYYDQVREKVLGGGELTQENKAYLLDFLRSLEHGNRRVIRDTYTRKLDDRRAARLQMNTDTLVIHGTPTSVSAYWKKGGPAEEYEKQSLDFRKRTDSIIRGNGGDPVDKSTTRKYIEKWLRYGSDVLSTDKEKDRNEIERIKGQKIMKMEDGSLMEQVDGGFIPYTGGKK